MSALSINILEFDPDLIKDSSLYLFKRLKHKVLANFRPHAIARKKKKEKEKKYFQDFLLGVPFCNV